MDRNAARNAIFDAWAEQPYAKAIGERDRAFIGVLRMVDTAIDALLALGWRPPNGAAPLTSPPDVRPAAKETPVHDEQNLPSVTVTDSRTFRCPYCGGEGITAGRGSDEFAAPPGHTILLDVAGRNLIRCHWNRRNRDWWLECGGSPSRSGTGRVSTRPGRLADPEETP